MTAKKKTRADLEREIRELKGQLTYQYRLAQEAVTQASKDKLMGSGAVLTITALGGRVIVDSVVIRDGLSGDTIAALQKDFVESYRLAVEFKPKE